MSIEAVVVGAVVLAAVLFLAWRFRRSLKAKDGCGSSCACDSKDRKITL